MQQVELLDTSATLRFDRGRCTVVAEPRALVLRIEAADATSLEQLEQLIGSDLERFGNRDRLTVTWHRSDDHRDGDHDHHHDRPGGDHSHGPGDAHGTGR